MERLSTEYYTGSYLSKNKDYLPLIEKVKCTRNETKAYQKDYAELVFMLEGECSLSLENYPPCVISAGEMFFIPPHKPFSAKANKDLIYLVIKVENYISMYNQMDLNKAVKIGSTETPYIIPIPIKPVTQLFVESLSVFIDDGMTGNYFHELKIKEIIFILKNYYNPKELKELFSPVLTKNFSFANFVLTHYLFVRSVKELAQLSPYSQAGFEKEFKKVFDMTPHEWMMKRREERVYYDIKYTNKPLKDIARDAGFNHLSKLCNFCQKHFKNSPGKMRKV